MNEKNCRVSSNETPALPDVPAEVRAALDRMCAPLDESVLSGATAAADARCMRVIRDYVFSARPSQTARAERNVVGDALCNEIIDRHLATVESLNFQARAQVKQAMLKAFAEWSSLAEAPIVREEEWISVDDRMPQEGLEVHTRTDHPVKPGDVFDTDWLEEGCFCEEKGPVSHWRPKLDGTIRYPVTLS